MSVRFGKMTRTDREQLLWDYMGLRVKIVNLQDLYTLFLSLQKEFKELRQVYDRRDDGHHPTVKRGQAITVFENRVEDFSTAYESLDWDEMQDCLKTMEKMLDKYRRTT